MSLEAIDVWDTPLTCHRPPMALHYNLSTTVMIPRDVYDRDLRACLRTHLEVQRQLEVDCPREVLFVDGVRSSLLPNMVEFGLRRFCTQAVFGLPLSLIGVNETFVVAELQNSSPMQVHIWTDTAQVVAFKELRIVHKCSDKADLVFSVTVDVHPDFVTVLFEPFTSSRVRGKRGVSA